MKYMKLGSKPDLFQAEGNNVRFVASELAADIIVCIDDVRFYLHKFPLLSKSNFLHKLILRASEERTDEARMDDFPGGPKVFEICAKFCYGMVVTLNAYNVAAARCAAEYLEMTEDIERGNLVYKIDVFLNTCIFRSWRDSIIVLQTTTALLPWSEDLNIIGKCVDSIASKASTDPSIVNWSYAYNKKLDLLDQTDDGIKSVSRIQPVVPKDWWVEDICDLDVQLYKRVMLAVKSKGNMSPDVMGEALRTYAIRWLPNSVDVLISDDYISRNRSLVETIICLLPSDKGSRCSCSFLLKLLKVVILIGIDDPLKQQLTDRISQLLDKAVVKDLLIPAKTSDHAVYDVQLVLDLVQGYMMKNNSNHSSDCALKDEVACDLVLGNASLLAVGKLVDGYLAEIACDPNLSLSIFIDLSKSLPEAARPIHDGLYTAIDIYLKEHGCLTKAEKKLICRLMDVKKLTAEACSHAAQNERLPLRVVVQVLYFEQVRAAAKSLTTADNDTSRGGTRSTADVEEDWEKMESEHPTPLKKQFGSMKIRGNEALSRDSINSRSTRNGGGAFLLPSRSRRFFDKFWVGKPHAENNNKSSETSGSSQSPSTSVNHGEVKSTGSSSMNKRHSIS